MTKIKFSIWRLETTNPEPGAYTSYANQKTFQNLDSVKDKKIEVNYKEAYSISIQKTTEYIFWMIEHGKTEPRDKKIFNIKNRTERDNPRKPDELEFMEQFFALYDFTREVFFISDLRKRGIFKELLKRLDHQLDIEFKGLYVDEKQFVETMQTISEVSFIPTHTLFSTSSDRAYYIEQLIGAIPDNEMTIRMEFKHEKRHILTKLLNNTQKESREYKIKALLIRGHDESGFEKVLNQDGFIKKIYLKDLTKESTSKFAMKEVLTHLLSEIERLSDELAK